MNTSDNEILFFTAATGVYQHFIAPFVYFAKLHNNVSKFEFIVDSVDEIYSTHKTSFDWLKDNYDCEIVLRAKEEFEHFSMLDNDNSLRFVMEPQQKSNYVYLCDVDILIIEDLMKYHMKIFLEGAPYSNVIRKDSKRLTGLHLTKRKSYYPINHDHLPSLIAKHPGDEELLYAIVEDRGNLVIDYESPRPTHGIHMSLNRFPFGSPKTSLGWGVTYERCLHYEKIFSTDEFDEFYHSLNSISAANLMNLLMITRGVTSISKDRFLELK